ncbi:hypothetical protein JCM11251_004617 [Rhodosporidiobolus azoricus]
MHCFVRDLSGRSVSIDAETVSDLSSALSSRLSIPSSEQRLTYGPSTLSDPARSLSSYGLPENGTVSLSLRLRGGAPKKRCAAMLNGTERCSQAAVRIVGDCTLCSKSFCGTHRLVEDHSCPNIDACKDAAFQRNKVKLEQEMTVSEKLARV